jgi:uncharacterized protein YqgC (DUF456 family)
MIIAFLRFLLGILCLLLGIFALVTPLTPGSWLILVGMELLGIMSLMPARIREPYDLAKTKTWEWIRKKTGR